ncbi:NADH dehydrogenase subunit 4L [Tanacetum coccineum]
MRSPSEKGPDPANQVKIKKKEENEKRTSYFGGSIQIGLREESMGILSIAVGSLFKITAVPFREAVGQTAAYRWREVELVFSVSSDDMMGQSFASLVPTVAATESAIGLEWESAEQFGPNPKES